MARDDFSEEVKRKLRLRAGNICSNPDCKANTSAASNDSSTSVNSIGVAAHISAASKGGKRYLKGLSKKERSSIDNGIWLCQGCSVKIDRDESTYSIALLHDWKDSAEKFAQSELGRRPPQRQDAIDAVVAAMTAQSSKFNASVIPNVIRASETALEEIDPNVAVKANFIDGKTSFEIRPKQPGTLKIHLHGKDAQSFAKQHKDLIEHAKPLSLETSELTLEGSKLLEELISKTDRVSFQLSRTHNIRAIQKIWLINSNTNEEYHFDDLIGEISGGTKTFTFNGSCCDGIFFCTYKKSYSTKKTNSTFGLNSDLWNNSNILELKFFPKLHSFYNKASTPGWFFYTSLEVNGQELMRSDGIDISNESFATQLAALLNYLELARELAKYLNAEIQFKDSIEITREDYIELARAVQISKGCDEEFNASNATPYSMEVIVGDKDKIKRLIKSQVAINTTLSQKNGEILKIMEQDVTLPPKEFVFESIIPTFDGDPESIQEGETIKIDCVPTDTSRYKARFI